MPAASISGGLTPAFGTLWVVNLFSLSTAIQKGFPRSKQAPIERLSLAVKQIRPSTVTTPSSFPSTSSKVVRLFPTLPRAPQHGFGKICLCNSKWPIATATVSPRVSQKIATQTQQLTITPSHVGIERKKGEKTACLPSLSRDPSF